MTERNFLWKWGLANAAAGLIGTVGFVLLLAPVPVGLVLGGVGGLVLLLGAWVPLGIAAGLFQWLALRRWLRARSIAGTALGVSLAWAVSLLIISITLLFTGGLLLLGASILELDPEQLSSQSELFIPLATLMCAAPVAGGGLLAGLAQWLSLKQRGSRPWGWLGVNVLHFGIGWGAVVGLAAAGIYLVGRTCQEQTAAFCNVIQFPDSSAHESAFLFYFLIILAISLLAACVTGPVGWGLASLFSGMWIARLLRRATMEVEVSPGQAEIPPDGSVHA